jgi:hypothetical protein
MRCPNLMGGNSLMNQSLSLVKNLDPEIQFVGLVEKE